MAAAGFLPWGRSGRRDRSSYELVAVADRLDVVSGTAATAARLWYAAPAAAAVVWLAAVTGRRGVALAVGGVLAAAGIALAVAVRRSPLVARPGVPVTLVSAGVVGIGVVLALVEGRRRPAR